MKFTILVDASQFYITVYQVFITDMQFYGGRFLTICHFLTFLLPLPKGTRIRTFINDVCLKYASYQIEWQLSGRSDKYAQL
jgi:hypothetical protein